MTNLASYQREHPLEQSFFRRSLRAVATVDAGASDAAPAPVSAPAVWTPVVEVYEDADSIRVMAELPGVQPADVSLTLEGNRLTIAGTKQRHEEEPAVKLRRDERTYGDFKRTFRLGAVVDFANVTATYDVGVLTVALPKAESAKRRQIPIVD